MKIKHIAPLPSTVFNQLGWEYYISEQALGYLANELVQISKKEAEKLYEATNEVYDLFVEAGEYVLQNNLLDTLGIPKNLHVLIRHTWERENHLHLFGRFDWAGGIHEPLKLLEFNADTPTTLPETAILQWLQLKANQLDENKQFNTVYDDLVNQFIRLKQANPSKEPRILFSTLSGYPEDDNNVALLMEAAAEAGFFTDFCFVEDVTFSEFDGIFAPNQYGDLAHFGFWFKLIPWEFIAEDEPELCEILTRLVTQEKLVIVNPAYTMLFQSKGILPILAQLFPENPYLLPTFFEIPKEQTARNWVEKVVLGREGANVRFIDASGRTTDESLGDYAYQKTIFQEKTNLERDDAGYYYQAGVFFAYQASGLSFRRAKQAIMDNSAQFIGHYWE
ncbi:MAG: glutathionylspermidine synthase family protein [Spirosomataceae bacterium]